MHEILLMSIYMLCIWFKLFTLHPEKKKLFRLIKIISNDKKNSNIVY